MTNTSILHPAKWIWLGALSLLLGLASPLFGQGVTTSSLTGSVVDKEGKAISGATVTAVHVPSGTRSVTETRANGQFDFSGLRPGGPYSVTITGSNVQAETRNDIFLTLDEAAEVDFRVSAEVVTMEAVTVAGSNDTVFDSGNMGTGTAYNRFQVEQIPTTRRDVQDIANLDTRVGLTINTSTGEFSVSAQGQNSRFNSFLIDGVQANDPFGLNANGFSSLGSPVPWDAIEAFTIDLNPYDVTRTGFTGALIDVVTKSGTNEFHGDIYAFYAGSDLRGPDPGQGPTDPNRGIHDPFQEHTYGFTFGGPIIPNKLFFFVAIDDVRQVSLPTSPVIFAPTASALAQVEAAAATYGLDPGSFATLSVSQQKTFLGKLDWNINDSQRATLSYRRTNSQAPVYTDGTTYTEFSSNAYQSNRIDDNLSFQLNSTWTPDFHTEAVIAGSRYNGTATLFSPLAPEIYVNGVAGTNLITGAAVTNGQLDLGTNHSYQLNSVYANDYNGHLYGDYSWGDHTFKVGADVDKAGYTDAFVQYYTGLWGFASPAAFAAGNANYLRYQQAIAGYTLPEDYAHYSYTDAGLLAQDVWKPANTNLTIDFGLRFDYPYIPNKPLYLPAFQQAFGLPNNATGSGNYNVEPRLGFNYKLPTSLPIQVRGGAGLFQGTNPAVWIANSYSTTGILNTVTKGSSSASSTNPTISPAFDPAPGFVQTLPPPGPPTPSIDVTDPHFQTPTSWKGNLAVDVKLPWYGLVATAEADDLKVRKAIYYVDLNLKPSGVAPDGRIVYSGFTGAVPTFSTSILKLTNTDQGGTQDYTLQLSRPMANNWAFSFGYTHSHSTEVQPLTSSVASSNYVDRATENPNENIARTSSYEVPDKWVASATYEFHFFKPKYSATDLTAVFRAQTGHAYSWVFATDVNNDGVIGDDSFYVPAGPSDPKVVWADSGQEAAFFKFVNGTDLKRYEGQVVPANSSFNPWQKTFDLHLEQQIPIYQRVRVSLFADCLNFANLLNKSWGVDTGVDFATGYSGYNRPVAGATINSNGKYVYTFNGNTLGGEVTFTDLSRWQLQVGVKLEF